MQPINTGHVVKQITKTPEIIARLKQAIGSSAPVDNLAVFEAIALNNLPLRKKQHVYNGAVAQRSFLLEMALALETESRPLQVMHEGGVLPIGRVFQGRVVDGVDTELRVLFWVDKEHEDKIRQIDNGTIDQVSVGVLPKQMICSADGFDFFGPDASLENIFTGTTPDGHTVGENGVYCKMVGLEAFFEMSLVGQGGAQNARIVNNDQSAFSPHLKALAASTSLDRLALTATATIREKPTMDVKELLAELRTAEKDGMKAQLENEQLKATNLALTTERDGLKAQLADANKTEPAVKTELDALKVTHTETETKLTAADAALREICKKTLTAAGKVDATVPEKLEDVITTITETKITLVAGGKSQGAESDLAASAAPAVSAFRARR